MEKRISFDDFQTVKRIAQACNTPLTKRNKVKAAIEKLALEYQKYDTQIKALEAGIKQIYGLRVEELVKRTVEHGTDSNGKEVKTTKYVPTDIVTYDTEKKQYVITIPSAEEIAAEVDAVKEIPTTADGPGSDFDVDSIQQEADHTINIF